MIASPCGWPQNVVFDKQRAAVEARAQTGASLQIPDPEEAHVMIRTLALLVAWPFWAAVAMAETLSDPVAEIEAQLLAQTMQQNPAAAFSAYAGGCGAADYSAPLVSRPRFVDGFAFRIEPNRAHRFFRTGRRH
jgi:hypothetical protein